MAEALDVNNLDSKLEDMNAKVGEIKEQENDDMDDVQEEEENIENNEKTIEIVNDNADKNEEIDEDAGGKEDTGNIEGKINESKMEDGDNEKEDVVEKEEEEEGKEAEDAVEKEEEEKGKKGDENGKDDEEEAKVGDAANVEKDKDGGNASEEKKEEGAGKVEDGAVIEGQEDTKKDEAKEEEEEENDGANDDVEAKDNQGGKEEPGEIGALEKKDEENIAEQKENAESKAEGKEEKQQQGEEDQNKDNTNTTLEEGKNEEQNQKVVEAKIGNENNVNNNTTEEKQHNLQGIENMYIPPPPPLTPPRELTRSQKLHVLKMKLLPVGTPIKDFNDESSPKTTPLLERDEKGRIFARLPPPPDNLSLDDVQGKLDAMQNDFKNMKEGKGRGRRRGGRNSRGNRIYGRKKSNNNNNNRKRSPKRGKQGDGGNVPPPSSSMVTPLSPEQEIAEIKRVRAQGDNVQKLNNSWGINVENNNRRRGTGVRNNNNNSNSNRKRIPIRRSKQNNGKTVASDKMKGKDANKRNDDNKDNVNKTGGGKEGAEENEENDPLHNVFSRVRELLQLNLTRVIDMFRSMDSDNDGVLTKKELAIGLRNIGMELSRGEMKNLWNTFDRDHSGSVEYKELYQILRDSNKSSVDAEQLLNDSQSNANLTAKERRQIEYQLRVQRGKKEADRERAAAIKRIMQIEKARKAAVEQKKLADSELLTQRAVQSKTNSVASRRARALARKRIAERKKKKLLAEEKAKEKVEIERKRKLIEKQGLAELGHQKIVKRLNRQIKKTYMAKAKQMEIEEARKENEEHVVDKVEAEMNAFKENRRHSDIARETKERIRRQKMKAKKVVEDEKQYQRDKLRMYQMHRTYMEEVGASVGATVMSPVRVPRRLRPPKPMLSPEMIEKAEHELGARNRNDSLQVLFEQAKRIEAPSFVPGDNVYLRPANERTLNLFKKGHLGGPLQKSVSSPILRDTNLMLGKKLTNNGPKGKNPWRNRAPVPIKDVSVYASSKDIKIKEEGPRWKEFKRTDLDASAGSPISWQATQRHQQQMANNNINGGGGGGYSQKHTNMLKAKKQQRSSSNNILRKSGSNVMSSVYGNGQNSDCTGVCPEGHYCVAGTATKFQSKCPLGRYASTGKGLSVECEGACPQHATTLRNKSASSIADCVCDSEYFYLDGICKKCAKGYTFDENLPQKCRTCDKGKFKAVEGWGQCVPCPTGTYAPVRGTTMSKE